MAYYIFRKNDELTHHGVKGMKWGVRKDKQISDRKKRKIAQKEAVEELDRAIKKAKATATNEWDDDENGVSGNVYKNSKTMRMLTKRLSDAYKERNKVYDTDDDFDIYDAGAKFEKVARATIDDVLGKYGNRSISDIDTSQERYKNAKDVCMKLIERADWHNIGTEYYHDKAWLYWH